MIGEIFMLVFIA